MQTFLKTSIFVYFFLFNACQKQDKGTDYQAWFETACQSCFDNNPLTNLGDSTKFSFSGMIDGNPVCYAVDSSGYFFRCDNMGMGYTPVNSNGTIVIDGSNTSSQGAKIGLNPKIGVYKQKPFISISTPFIKYNPDSVRTSAFILDRWLNEPKLKFAKNGDPRIIRDGFEFEIYLFCPEETYNYRKFQPFWRLSSLSKKQSNSAFIKLTHFLKEEHVLSYEYTLTFEIECKLFTNDGTYYGWLREGVFKTNFHVPK